MATAEDDARRVLGRFIRAQRQMANLSLRQLSVLAKVSNPYLSQVERGLHDPSVRVLKSIGEALNLSAETLFEQAGLARPTEGPDDQATERAIRADRRLTEAQRQAILGVYRSYVGHNHIEDSHIEDSHVDDSHVDDSHVDDSRVDDSDTTA